MVGSARVAGGREGTDAQRWCTSPQFLSVQLPYHVIHLDGSVELR
jgi:hypothetical protein